MNPFRYKSETYSIIGCCMEVHRQLGRGFAEVIYKDAVQIELDEKKIPFQREKTFPVRYKDIVLPRSYVADFVVYDKIILELKAVKELSEAHISQTLNYMRISGCEVGLLINFNEDSLEYRRFVL